jgi:CRP/FNR family transcriptional regulator, cyclic AMP receptor protein
MTVSVDILQQFPLLATLPKVTLAELSKTSELKSFNKREIVFSKGSQPQHLMFLFEGRLQGVDFTMDGKEVGCYFADPGDFFGELGVLDNQAHPETVIALVKSVVVFVPRHIIRPLMTTMPAMAESLTLKLAHKLRQAAEQRRIIGLANPLQKVCAQLWVMSQVKANNSPTAKIAMMPTHQELAIMINASRETVTRVFQLLQTKALVERQGNDLLILNVQVLQAISQGAQEQL